MDQSFARFLNADVAVEAAAIELSIIVPTFNEAGNVQRLIEKIAIALAGISWEVVFVDDNSPDGTADLVRRIAREDRRIRIVQRIGRRGLSSAVLEGMLASAAPYLAVIDGDMQHDETILPLLFEKVSSGSADIAIGTRYANGGGTGDWDAARVKLSKAATRIGKWVTKTELSDPMSGFMLLSRDTFMQAMPKLSGIGFKILLDIVTSLPTAPRIAEVPYVFRSRDAGESKASAVVAMEYVALLADKMIGHIIPLRLLSFLLIGGLGVGVHMTVLGSGIVLGLSFMAAQIAAVMVAMTFNFSLNNIFTYFDRRLRGWALLKGLLGFYTICSLGAVANVGIGAWAHDHGSEWWVAGLSGVVLGALWNFLASAKLTWNKQ